MVKRLACAGMLAFALSACQESKITDPTLITGGGPVAVLQSSYVTSGDSRAALGAGPVTYVISKIELTNDQTTLLFPVISHFCLTDRAGNRSFGIDTGAAVLAGVVNDVTPMKPAEKRTFTVGFRADGTTMGTIRYEY
jgi:hypothetical protein